MLYTTEDREWYNSIESKTCAEIKICIDTIAEQLINPPKIAKSAKKEDLIKLYYRLKEQIQIEEQANVENVDTDIVDVDN